jgi:hypothetical protein
VQTRIANHIRSNIVGYIALVCFAMGGSAYALDGPLPGQNQVGSSDIINGEVKGPDMGPSSVSSAKILDGQVKTADLGLGAVNSSKIADGAIQGLDVQANALTGAQIDESTLSGVSATPTGGAGGDLSGAYPNPTIANAAVTIAKLGFDPATQAELDSHALADAQTFWKLNGNGGTTAANFLGTTDNQPLNLRANNARGLRIEPASDGTNQSPNVIGGIADNSVTPGVHSAVIAGGGRGVPSIASTANRVTDHQGVVGGGANNQAGNNAGTVGDATLATVGGGGNNTATGEAATVSGGFFNGAGGKRATVPGGQNNSAGGDFSFAAGRGAQATHQGSFVWADSKDNGVGGSLNFASTAANEFSVRSTGGARFVTGVDAGGNPNAGVSLAAGGGSWLSLSDRASKRAVRPASGRRILRKLASVPVSTWSYRAQKDSIRHIGPMAQDFYKAFGVGEDRRHIASVDADGVALAAIKGLSRELRTERRRRHQEERRLDRLAARVAALEQRGGGH